MYALLLTCKPLHYFSLLKVEFLKLMLDMNNQNYFRHDCIKAAFIWPQLNIHCIYIKKQLSSMGANPQRPNPEKVLLHGKHIWHLQEISTIHQ